MPRMPKKRKLELSFFLNERGRVTYNDLCRKCQRTCKQSFRAVIVDCPHYLSKRSKRKVKEDIYEYDFDNLNKVEIVGRLVPIE